MGEWRASKKFPDTIKGNEDANTHLKLIKKTKALNGQAEIFRKKDKKDL